MILLSRLFMLLIVVILLVFCMSNLDPVTVKLVGWESPQMPLFLILLFVFFFGFFLALFWQALRSVTMKKEFKPATVMTPATKPEKEKKNRSWGLKKGKKTDIDSVKKQEEDAPEEHTSEDENDSTPRPDEPAALPEIEDK